MIPIPLLGGVLGIVAGRIVIALLTRKLETDGAELTARLTDYIRWAMAQLDEQCREIIARLDEHFMELERLTKLAFDPRTNTDLRLRTSATLAREVSVPDALILDSADEIDAFMTE